MIDAPSPAEAQARAESTPNDAPPANKQADAPGETQERKREPPHPIGSAIDAFLHRTRDIEVLERLYLPAALQRRAKTRESLKAKLAQGRTLLDDGDQRAQIEGIKVVTGAIRSFKRLINSRVPSVLESSLFLGLFSAYDAFTGDLLSAIYSKRPELLDSLNRTVSVKEVLHSSSFDAFKEKVVQDEIEAFRRKSYVEQFSSLQATFGINLTAFQRWPHFVECGQRRNLLTHCDGLVSEQYLKVCDEHGASLPKDLKVGDRLALGPAYFLASCALAMEVGLKLGHTLWRKLFPEELTEADAHLHTTCYDALSNARWDTATVFCEFAAGQKQFSDEVGKRITVVNLAIAFRMSGKNAECMATMAKFDWSASLLEFRLADHVLAARWEDAAKVVLKLGKKGEILSEHDYHTWPLFREFRERPEFLVAYEKVYGRPFAYELGRVAEKAEASGDAAMSQEQKLLSEGLEHPNDLSPNTQSEGLEPQV